ncbi:hypothetical protein ACIHEJ_38835 [Streptomyces sp. NPDC052301]|uniref:hypothetical protein n=1 Tax=Streptomyces sp. NPDC052301 TaxID=3365687 RepID=UPI0037D45B8C
MSDTTQPPVFPPPLPPEPPTPAKKNRTNLVIIGAATAVIAAVIGTGTVVVNSQDHGGKQDSKAGAAPSVKATAASEPDPTPTYVDVDENSFTIELKTTKRQCFGSAGCNLTVEPRLTYLGDDGSIDPDAVYEITYEIHGDESGPVIETAELTDQTSLNYTPSVISTTSAATKVSVEITDVEAQGS